MKLQDKIYTDKAEAGEMILNLCKQIKDTESMSIGEYRGFKMELQFNGFEKAFQIVLRNKEAYRVSLGADKIGIITRLNNGLESIDKRIEDNTKELENTKKQLENAKENVNIPFAQEKEYQECTERLKQVNKELKIGDTKEKEIIIEEDDELSDEVIEKNKRYERV